MVEVAMRKWSVCIVLAVWCYDYLVASASGLTPARETKYTGYKFEVFDTQKNYSGAEAFCKQRGGWIIEPKSEELNKEIGSILTTDSNYFIGLKHESGWKWRNGQKTTESNWRNGKGTATGEKTCALLSHSDKKWFVVSCDETRRFACQIPQVVNSTTYNGFLFKTFDVRVTFTEANYICKERGGWPAEPKSAEINAKLGSILSIKLGYFIGLKYKSGWKWRNEQEITYRNWRHNEGRAPGQETCAIISQTAQDWHDVTCETRTRHCACQIHRFCKPSTDPCRNNRKCIRTSSTPYYACNCENGYYGKHCAEYLQVIPTKSEVIGVDGDQSISMSLKVRTTEGGVTLKIYYGKNAHPVRTKQSIGNDKIVTITFTNVTRSMKGKYIASAHPTSINYVANASFKIVVHEKASISKIFPLSIFSPPTKRRKNITCSASGFPIPTAAWFRNGKRVISEPRSKGVYQSMRASKATLYVQNARLTERGIYVCVASNKVDSKRNKVSDNGTAFLTVYGTPMIMTAKTAACKINGFVEVLWSPNNQTRNIFHNTTLMSLNSSQPHIETRNTTQQNVSFGNLLPSTSYEIKVTVCPDDCISKLSATTMVTTGVGLPGKVNNFSLKKEIDSATCSVEWSWPEKNIKDQISYFEVTWISERIYNPSKNAAEPKVYNVSFSTLHHNISAQPNRNYSVEVRAFTCAGPGPIAKANGRCFTEPENPPFVPTSSISTNHDDGDNSAIDLALPDENNGRISCMFVIIGRQGNDSEVSSYNELERLTNASMAAQNKDEMSFKDYLALAIPRSHFNAGKYKAVLGDDKTTSCDPNAANSVMQKPYNHEDDTDVKGRNWPLRTDGTTYRYWTVTSTARFDKKFLLKSSKMSRFMNGSPPYKDNNVDDKQHQSVTSSAIIILTVTTTLSLLLAIMCGSWVLMLKKRLITAQSGERQNSMNVHAVTDEFGYENTEFQDKPEDKQNECHYEEISSATMRNMSTDANAATYEAVGNFQEGNITFV